MNLAFDLFIEFDRNTIQQHIEKSVSAKTKGYVCVVDGNVLATAHKNADYKKIINNATINTCDGSSIAILAGLIHGKKLETYTGPELFANLAKKPYRHLFLGNTTDVHERLKNKFIAESINTSEMFFETLPFKKVDEFDYDAIAKTINTISPDIIWVSLGAPKQEYFIGKLYPLVHRGVLIAIGAAFNLYINDAQHKRAPEFFLKLKLEWLYRSWKNPSRVGKRALNYALLLPKIVFKEIKTVYFTKHKLQ